MFLINVNVSNIIKDTEDTHYTMLIDDSKMTIVYELTEWIRWIFSFKQCFYLTHKNCIIHDLEDIKLLSLLKTFEIKICNQNNCIHKQGYKTFLDKLNIFIEWKEFKIPKILYEKLNNMNKKFNSKYNYSEEEKLIENEITNQPSCINKNDTINCNMNFHEVLGSKHSDQSQILNNENFKKISSNDNREVPNKLLIEKTTSVVDIININKEDIVGQLGICSQSKNESQDISNFTSENKQQQKTDTDKNIGRKKKYFKPFSLSEVLNNLRNESEKEIKEGLVEEVENIISPEKQNDMNVEVLGNDQDHCLLPVKRKRKRIRKHKSKKQKLMTENFDSYCELNDLSEKSYEKKKSNHIRFDSEDEKNVDHDNFYEAEESVENVLDNYNIKKDSDSSKYIKIDTEKVMEIINDNNECNNILTDSSGTYDYQTLSDFLTAYNQEGNKKQLNVFQKVDFDPENEIHPFPTTKKLTTLQEKFPHPKIIERFH